MPGTSLPPADTMAQALAQALLGGRGGSVPAGASMAQALLGGRGAAKLAPHGSRATPKRRYK